MFIVNIDEILKIISESVSKNDALLQIYGYTNKRVYEKLNKIISEHCVDVTHYEKKSKFCKECGKIITISINKFCDSSCSAKYNNKKRKLLYNTKIKISNSLKVYFSKKDNENTLNKSIGTCVICDKEFTKVRFKNKRISKSKTCSVECRKKLRIDNTRKSINERIKNGLHRGWITRNVISYPERFFMEVLDNNNIKYTHNYPVSKRDLGLDNSYNYFLDFYIENKKLDLEIDGKQHKYRKKHDNERDNILRKNGYNVYRIQWKCINTEKGKQYIKEEIDKFLKYYNNI